MYSSGDAREASLREAQDWSWYKDFQQVPQLLVQYKSRWRNFYNNTLTKRGTTPTDDETRDQTFKHWWWSSHLPVPTEEYGY